MIGAHYTHDLLLTHWTCLYAEYRRLMDCPCTVNAHQFKSYHIILYTQYADHAFHSFIAVLRLWDYFELDFSMTLRVTYVMYLWMICAWIESFNFVQTKFIVYFIVQTILFGCTVGKKIWFKFIFLLRFSSVKEPR